jgi:hypothetical protein
VIGGSVSRIIKLAEEIREEADRDEDVGIVYAAKHIILNAASVKGKVELDIPKAKEVVQNYVQTLLDADQFEAAATILWGPNVYDWRPMSSQNTWRCLFEQDKLLIQGAGAMGKCLLKGTQVIMSDGTLNNVENVKIGDKVMGPDGKPRNVVDLHSGISPMYRIDQERGESYTVTDDHILTLACTENKKNGDKKTISSNYTKGKMIDIGLQEYLKSSKQFKNLYKGVSCGVDFDLKEIAMEPYVFGLWLGDGNGKGDRLGLTTMDDVTRDSWISYWENLGGKIVKTDQPNNKSSVYFVNGIGTIKKVMSFALKDNEKTIPDCYKLNSRDVRLNVLAGFIDTDGYAAGPGYGYIQKNKDIAYSIAFIARSLGLDVTVKQCRKRCVNNGVWGTYYRGHISGDCSIIPCRLKKCEKRKVKVPIGKKITVTPVGDGEYYGFVLDGDKRFLLSDFTITHNTFGAAAWFLLDWMRDPHYTCIKVVSLTAEHAQRNVFAAIKKFYTTALVRPEFEGSETLVKSIQANNDSKNGIHLVAVPRGDSGTGTLRGFHPSPRSGKSHPKWGRMSRTHVVLDEAEEVPAGVWEGLQNILSAADTEGAKGRIKIFGASNPKDRTSEFGKRCEPVAGWGSIDCEDDLEWKSRDAWHVLRLDAAKCENVIEKKIVFPGLQTYEGFQAYESKGKTAEYYTMARGWFPQEGVSMSIITPSMMDNAMGITRFVGPVVPLCALDLALEGNDQVICSYGRFGLSDGYTPMSGKFIEYKNPKVVLQLDSQIPFPKAATLEQSTNIIRFCKQMRIAPNWVCVDRTGNGAGIHDSLCTVWGDVLGVNYSTAATDTHILGDDSLPASQLYSGVVTELIFGLAKYLEFEYLKISPGFRSEELVRQATARRYKQKGQGLVRVESKGDYCKRTRQHSPDALDSLSLLVFLLRQRGGAIATMNDAKPELPQRTKALQGIEKMEYVDFSE